MHPAHEIRCTKSSALKGKRIVLGITGSIAAVETIKLARELTRHGAEVYPVMSKAAQEIIHPYSIHFACGFEPITQLTGKVEHVAICGEVQDRADMLLIAPATANTISKIAMGIDDTPVTTFATTAIGSGIKVSLAPAMHASMYKHPVVMENLEKLKSMGIEVIMPKMEEKKAKLASNPEIVNHVLRSLGKASLKGRKVLVIGGAGYEPLDDFRIITNKSSGETAAALAQEAYFRGADVRLIMGSHDVELPSQIERFGTLDELKELIKDGDADIILVPAALPDFKSKNRTQGKIPSTSPITLELEPTRKMVDSLAGKGFLVMFKAEAGVAKEELEKRAFKSMRDSRANMIVANDVLQVKSGITEVSIITGSKTAHFKGTKTNAAIAIWNSIEDALHDPK